MKKRTLIVQDYNNLHLDIHTIGYPNEGESLLTLLCDGDKVLFSVQTDCFEYKHYNHAKELLNRLQVKQIDAFIWTHPHQDHSVGIPDFLDEFDPNHTAEIFLPSGLFHGLGIKQKAKEALDYVNKHYNSNRKYNVKYIQVNNWHSPTIPLLSLNIEVMKPRVIIGYSHYFLSPNDIIVSRAMYSDKPLINDFSIAYSILFNNFSFLFYGDLSERNVKFIDPHYYRGGAFINLPHHGSDNVKSLVSLIRSQNVTDAIITTTVFKRHHLPKPQVLNDYCTISDGVYCTSNIQNESSEPYGCITAKFHANMQRPEIITSGNAYCYFNRRT